MSLSHLDTVKPTASDNAIPIEGVNRSDQRIEHGTILLKKRGDRYKQQLRVTMRQLSEVSLESETSSKRLLEKIHMLEKKNKKLEKAKEGVEDRWKTAKGEFKAVLQKLKNARNQNAYLEALLSSEERSGFSTLVSDLEESMPLYMLWNRLKHSAWRTIQSRSFDRL